MEINGWLNIYKPYKYSSAKIVAIVKRLLKPLGAKKVGHGGTLDPLATGILPICINKATKTTQYTMDYKKTYRFDITFGEERSTDDAEGEIISKSDKIPTLEEIEGILPKFLGKIQQTPPSYSAIKVNGKRAYDLARKGIDFKLKSREVEVFDLKCKGFVEPKIASFEVECGKGFYIRSLGKDLARALGTYGYISKLERTKVGIFTKENSLTIEELKEVLQKNELKKYLIQVKAK